MKDVYNFLDSLKIKASDTLLVAVSYGPDSMCLLDLLKKRYNENKIVCCHVHHNHRKESDIEAEELENYCKINNIDFEFMKITEYKNNRFTEEEARNKRYEFFLKLSKKYNSKYLFTAHHGDDLVETVLMRLTRGSNIKGYQGIKLISKRDNISIIRPLLYFDKDEILEYCDKYKIPYAVDKSNFELDQTRNRYRNKVLPFLKEENKDIHRKIISFSNELKLYQSYAQEKAKKIYDDICKDDVLYITNLLKEHDVIIKIIVEMFLQQKYKTNIDLINSNHVSNIIDVIKNEKSNITISMPGNYNLIKSYNKLYFDKKACYNGYCFMFDSYVEVPNDFVIKKIDKLEGTSNYYAAFNLCDIEFPLYVRSRLDGDKIEVLGLNGAKKVKDIFIDEKVDIKERENYPILVDNSGKILWIPGLKKSKYDKSKQEKYDIIFKYYRKEI